MVKMMVKSTSILKIWECVHDADEQFRKSDVHFSKCQPCDTAGKSVRPSLQRDPLLIPECMTKHDMEVT